MNLLIFNYQIRLAEVDSQELLSGITIASDFGNELQMWLQMNLEKDTKNLTL